MVLREFSPRVEGKSSGCLFKKVTLPVTIDLRIIDVVSGQVKFARNHIQEGSRKILDLRRFLKSCYAIENSWSTLLYSLLR